MIVKSGDKWLVKSADGEKTLGTFDSEAEAKKRLKEIETFKSKKQVNILTVINSASNISMQEIDGEPHYIIKNVVPIVDDIVMNDGLYPAEEIASSYMGLDGQKAPYNHPKVDGNYVSINHPRALNANYYIGAWIENPSRAANKTMVDLKVNIRVANGTIGGKETIKRIEDLMNNVDGALPIEISTGLMLNRIDETGESKGKKYKWRGTNFQWDHLAILPPNIPGAGRPSDGVGIFAHNGLELERDTVNLIDSTIPDVSINHLQDKGALKKLINFIINKTDLSFDDIAEQIRGRIKTDYPGESWPYIVAIYDGKFGYEIDGKLYLQHYHIDSEDVIQFDGTKVRAKRTTELEPIEINNEVTEMTPEELKAAMTEALKPTQEQLTAVNTELAAVKAQNEELKTTLAANANKEVEQMRKDIKDKLKYPESVVNSLSGDALKDAYALITETTGINGELKTNSKADPVCNMPE
ncbi:prohead protease [Yersinia phage vB_YenS_P400]|nr:prohead protease [Yersinia phage vB_YenS_P400]